MVAHSFSRALDIVIVGGGTGAQVLAEAARRVRIAGRRVIVSTVNATTDDGGSTALLRALRPAHVTATAGRHFYMPAPGDVRRSIVALSARPRQAEALLNARRADGHATGNLMIYEATCQAGGDFVEGVAAVARRMGVRGRVIPATDHPEARIELVNFGRRYRGEHFIDSFDVTDPEAYVELTHGARLTSAAYQAIAGADIVIMAMGSEHTSQHAVAAIPGFAEALTEQYRQGGLYITYANPTVADHISMAPPHIADKILALERYTPDRSFDYVLYHDDATSLPADKRHKALRYDPEGFAVLSATCIGGALISSKPAVFDPNDRLAASGQRQTMRHDVRAITTQLTALAQTFAGQRAATYAGQIR